MSNLEAHKIKAVFTKIVFVVVAIFDIHIMRFFHLFVKCFIFNN